MSDQNAWVIPCIAGNLLMIVLTSGWWLLAVAAWGIWKYCKYREKEAAIDAGEYYNMCPHKRYDNCKTNNCRNCIWMDVKK